MKILRIQDREGFGPYAGRQDISGDLWQDSPHGEIPRTPGPMDDTLLRDYWYNMKCDDRQEWRFGFISGSQMRNWFTKSELTKLIGLGFRVVKLEVKEAVSSNFQAMYRRETTCVNS